LKVTREATLPTEITLNIELEPEELEPYLDRAYRRVVNKVRVPGFRQGKAPRAVVEGMVGREHLLHEALDFMVPESVDKAVKQENIQPFVQPDIDILKLDPIQIKATVPLEPKVDLGGYQELRLEAEKIEVTEDKVTEVLERLSNDLAPWEPVEGPVQFEDLVTLNMDAKSELRTIANQKAVEFIPSLQNQLPLPGFSVQLEGAKKGETRTFTLKAPEDFGDKSVAGKDVEFKVTVHEIKRKNLPALDDDFAKGAGQGYESLEALKNSVRESLTRAAQREANRALYDKALKKVIEGATIEMPEMIVHREVDHMIREQAQALRSRRMDMETYLQQVGKTQEDLHKELEPQAKERTVRSLVLNKMAEDFKIEVSEEEVSQEIQETISSLETRDTNMGRLMTSPSMRASVESSIRVRKTLERLAEVVQGKAGAQDAVETAAKPASEEGGTQSDA
jgi:trigger factor